MPERRLRIEFWQDERGAKPVLDWIKNDLSDEQRAALGKAMQHTLQVLGRLGLTRVPAAPPG